MNISTVTIATLLFTTSLVASANVKTITGKVVDLDTEAKTVSIESKADKKLITYRYLDGLTVENVPRSRKQLKDLRKGQQVVLTLETAKK